MIRADRSRSRGIWAHSSDPRTLLGPTAVAIAAPSAQAQSASNCRLTVKNVDGLAGNEVKAIELNERVDDIFLRIDGKRFPTSGTVAFSFAGQGRSPVPFANPTRVFNAGEEILMEVVEADPVFPDNMGTNLIPGAPLHSTLVFNDGGVGAYTVEVEVEQI